MIFLLLLVFVSVVLLITFLPCTNIYATFTSLRSPHLSHFLFLKNSLASQQNLASRWLTMNMKPLNILRWHIHTIIARRTHYFHEKCILTIAFDPILTKNWPFKAYWLRGCTNSLTFNNCTLCPTLYLCVLYLSENKQWLVPLTA